jgi:hypothetical protein
MVIGYIQQSHPMLGKLSKNKGRYHSEESIKKMSEAHKEWYKNNPHPKGMLGKENKWGKHTEETKQKIREARARQISPMKGRHHTKETLKILEDKVYSKIRNKTYEEIYGLEKAREISSKIKRNSIGHKRSNDAKIKMSLVSKGKPKSENHKMKLRENSYWKGKHLSDETKLKMRISALKYIKEICGNICPHIGHNEKAILDKLEQELNQKIIRQYSVEGYFVDGYIPKLNIIIEIDEVPKNKERDIKRQQIIENKLNCKFIRIKDYEQK